MSLYPWRPVCGCLIDEVDGEPQVLEWCGRHDGCRLAVVNATYPPVTNTVVEPVPGSPAPDHAPAPTVTTERRYNPAEGTPAATTHTADPDEARLDDLEHRLADLTARLDTLETSIHGDGR